MASYAVGTNCPFLTCLSDGPHCHLSCKDCGAVRYGNLFCSTCLAYAQGKAT